MERGLLWLPLLGVFIWLAWAGWHEYRKLEAYKIWATEFERAKYDIYAALGQVDARLVWGRPTRQGPKQLQAVTLDAVTQIALRTSPSLPATASLPKGCDVCLELTLESGEHRWIPFTDTALAAAWQNRLQTLQKSLQSTPQP
ncbi:MAG: hypothetical protein AAGH67_08145 [Cyanobacteria bacterium P01_H01_bin.162]